MSRLIRQSHRWISMAFTLTVIANFIAIGMGHAIPWLYYLPLPPLFLLLGSGLYLFALLYVGKWRAPHAKGI
ncbi:hypothetical protein [Devosia psychrophila]|uniref:Membrane protein n=1 Tax=Devosia psychrophila TaxID=728005 RepID=A0A0F5PYP1_9HYPH|nr:hypothetical protein [Devosia psychrophila]KKC32944.1 membrane protein [Devosia psychrophila]SFD06030.1 hypothetical protein SAMN04488059_11939 [Devosia psychrophila]